MTRHPSESLVPESIAFSACDRGSARRLAVVALLASLLSGCTVGPDYVRPEADVADRWMETGSERIKAVPADLSTWWSVLQDPVLDALIEEACSRNLTLHAAGVRILESRAIRGIALGSQYPQLQQLRGSYSRVELSETAANQRQADHGFGDYQFGIDVGWEIDLWGKFRRGVEASTAELQATIAAYDDLVTSLTAEVALAYVEVRTLQRRLVLAAENVQIQERSLQIAETRFEGGTVTELDVSQARALLQDTRSHIPAIESAIRQVQNGLSVLLGRAPQDLLALLNGVQPIPTAPAEVVVGVPADLLRRRPDIRRAERLAAAQCAAIGIAEAELYPSFSLFGALGLQTGDAGGSVSSLGTSVGDLFRGGSVAGDIGGGFSWPIFNYGRLRNNVRAEDARFQQLILAYQQTVLRAAQEVESAMTGFLKKQAQVALLEESVTAAGRSVVLASIQYRDGAVDYQRVLDTQAFLAQQQDRLATLRGDSIRQIIAMYKGLGGGWEGRRIEDFVPGAIQDAMRARTDWGEWLPVVPPAASAGEKEPGTSRDATGSF